MSAELGYLSLLLFHELNAFAITDCQNMQHQLCAYLERSQQCLSKGEHESGSLISTSTCGFIRGKPTGQVTHRSEFLNGTGLY